MTGRITRLIDDQQFGVISGEDGVDYVFHSRSLIDIAFRLLHLGASVSFTPTNISGARRAEAVRVSSNVPEAQP